jgi:DNA-binding NarL/FixJ family response regulator
MNNPIHIMLVEDYKLIRVGIKSIFDEADGYEVICEADNGTDAIKKAIQYKPEIIILDLELPDMKGIKVIKEILNACIMPKIIVLSAYDNIEDIKKCISLGVYAYVIKDISTDSLLNIVKTVHKGAMWFDPKIVPKLRDNNYSINYSEKQTKKNFKNTHANLTPREFEVLKLIVDGKSNIDIAQTLCISEHTAKAHVCNIIQKLVVDDRTQAAVKAIKEGIIE